MRRDFPGWPCSFVHFEDSTVLVRVHKLTPTHVPSLNWWMSWWFVVEWSHFLTNILVLTISGFEVDEFVDGIPIEQIFDLLERPQVEFQANLYRWVQLQSREGYCCSLCVCVYHKHFSRLNCTGYVAYIKYILLHYCILYHIILHHIYIILDSVLS